MTGRRVGVSVGVSVQSLLSTLDVADVWLDGQHEQVSLEFNTLRSACTDFFYTLCAVKFSDPLAEYHEKGSTLTAGFRLLAEGDARRVPYRDPRFRPLPRRP